MNKDLIRRQIIRKFGTISKCAEALGVTQPTLSALLKRPSYKLIERLKAIGVEFPDKYTLYIDSDENISMVSEPPADYVTNIYELEIQIAQIKKELAKIKVELYKLRRQYESN